MLRCGACIFVHKTTGVASLDWKTPYEVEFGETPETSCLKCKFYQPVRVYDKFMTLPNHRWKNGRYLGVAQDSGDELTYIFETEYEDKTQLLVRSVIQDKFPEGGYPPRVRINIALAVLFQDPVSIKRKMLLRKKPLDGERLRIMPP